MAGLSYQINAEDKTGKATSTASKNLKGLGKASEDASKGVGGLSGSLGGIGKSLKGLLSLGTAVAAVTAVVAAVKKVTDTAKACSAEYEANQKSLVKLKMAYSTNSKSIKGAFDSMYSSLDKFKSNAYFGGDEIDSAAALANSYNLTAEQVKKVMQAATDCAASGIMPLDQAVKSLSLSYSGNVGQLEKINPQIKNLTKEQLKAGAAVEILGKQYAGLADAMSMTGEGWKKKMEAAKGDIKQSIGGIFDDVSIAFDAKVLPYLNKISEWLKEHRDQITNVLTHLPEVFKIVMETLWAMVKKTFTGDGIKNLLLFITKSAINSIVAVLNLTLSLIVALGKTIVAFFKHLFSSDFVGMVKDFVALIGNTLIETINYLIDKITSMPVIKQLFSLTDADRSNLITFRFKTDNATEAWQDIGSTFSSEMENAGNNILEGLKSTWKDEKSTVLDFASLYKDEITTATNRIAAIMNGPMDKAISDSRAAIEKAVSKGTIATGDESNAITKALDAMNYLDDENYKALKDKLSPQVVVQWPDNLFSEFKSKLVDSYMNRNKNADNYQKTNTDINMTAWDNAWKELKEKFDSGAITIEQFDKQHDKIVSHYVDIQNSINKTSNSMRSFDSWPNKFFNTFFGVSTKKAGEAYEMQLVFQTNMQIAQKKYYELAEKYSKEKDEDRLKELKEQMDAQNKIIEQNKTRSNEMGDIGDANLSGVQNAIGSIKTIISAFGELGEVIQNIMSKNWIGFIIMLIVKLVQALSECSSAFNDMLNVVSYIMKIVANMIKDDIEQIVKPFLDGATVLAKIIGEILHAIIQPLAKILGPLGDLLTNILYCIYPIIHIIVNILNIFNNFSPILNIVCGILKILAAVFEWFAKCILWAYNKIGAAFTAIANFFIWIINKIIDFLRPVLVGISNFFIAIYNGIQKVLDFIKLPNINFGWDSTSFGPLKVYYPKFDISWDSLADKIGMKQKDYISGSDIKNVSEIQFNELSWDDYTQGYTGDNTSGSGSGASASYNAARDVYVNVYYQNSYVNGDCRAIALSIRDEIQSAESLGY